MSNLSSLVLNYISNLDSSSDIEVQLNHHKNTSQAQIDQIYNNQRFIENLIYDFNNWGNILVAYDFDDTVKPLHSSEPCNLMVELLQVCTKLNFNMICYTARSTEEDFQYIRNTLDELGIRYDCINTDHPSVTDRIKECPTKLFYSVFLDDKAGLKQAYEVLWGFIDWYLKQDKRVKV